MKSMIHEYQKNKLTLMSKKLISRITILAFIAIASISCSGSEEPATPPPAVSVNKFNATIGTTSFSTSEVTLITISAGGTQGFYTTPKNGVSFSSAIFANQFPIGQAVNIAYSPSLSYVANGVTHIAKSGTMTLSIMEPYTRMKGTFTGVFAGGTADVNISGDFDVFK